MKIQKFSGVNLSERSLVSDFGSLSFVLLFIEFFRAWQTSSEQNTKEIVSFQNELLEISKW